MVCQINVYLHFVHLQVVIFGLIFKLVSLIAGLFFDNYFVKGIRLFVLNLRIKKKKLLRPFNPFLNKIIITLCDLSLFLSRTHTHSLFFSLSVQLVSPATTKVKNCFMIYHYILLFTVEGGVKDVEISFVVNTIIKYHIV